MRKLLVLLGILFSTITYSQKNDSISFKINYGVKSSEFQDYLSFKNVDYYNIIFYGDNLKGKSFSLVGREYWNKKLHATDTILNLAQAHKPRVESDSLNIIVLVEKTETDSMKINWRFKGLLGVTKKYKTTDSNQYSTRNLSDGKQIKIKPGTKFPLLVYSLPYHDPKYPGYAFYCELSRDGIPPEQWGEKFNLEHYIVFEMLIE